MAEMKVLSHEADSLPVICIFTSPKRNRSTRGWRVEILEELQKQQPAEQRVISQLRLMRSSE